MLYWLAWGVCYLLFELVGFCLCCCGFAYLLNYYFVFICVTGFDLVMCLLFLLFVFV